MHAERKEDKEIKYPWQEQDEVKSQSIGCSSLAVSTWIKITALVFLCFLLMIFLILVVGFGAGGGRNWFQKYLANSTGNTVDVEASRNQVIVEDSAIIDVAGNSSPAVVSIMISKNVSSTQSGQITDPFFGLPLGDGNSGSNQSDGSNTQKQVVGSGSGFLITTDGLILTNKHVVEDNQSEYSVITQDGKQYKAEILALDPSRDVAVIRISGNKYTFLELGDSDQVKIGQTVIAIGDSLGEFSNSVSRGIISGLKRNVNAMSAFGDTERLTDIIQTDAAINLGNSGGPLIDINGKVIGVNVARAQGAENIAFALPINQVKRLIDQVKSGKKISVAYLGVRYVVIDSLVQAQTKLSVDHGVLITRGSKVTDLAVLPGSPADLAGLVENDIILEINGEKITTNNQLGDIIAGYKVGDSITLKVWHKGQEKDIQVTLGELKQ